MHDATVRKTPNNAIISGNRGVLHPSPIVGPLPEPPELIDKRVEPKQSIGPTHNMDFEDNSPHQGGIILEMYINPDQSYFEKPLELIDLVDESKLVQNIYQDRKT